MTPPSSSSPPVAARGSRTSRRSWLSEDSVSPFDPPRYAVGATIGGAVAAGLAGPSRPRTGAVRDHVLGVRLLTGDGRHLRFGGEVMKNVAGFDVSRLMAGSLGILGVLLELSLRVLPMPLATITLVQEADAASALEQLETWSGTSLPMTASGWLRGCLYARFEGAAETVDQVRRQLGGEPHTDAAAFWASLRDQTHEFFASPARLWRLQLPTGGRLPVAADTTLIEWHGGQWWCRDDGATDLRAVAAAAGGSATLFRGATRNEEVFAPLAPTVLELHRRLKRAFDPAGILNPGRMYAGL